MSTETSVRAGGWRRRGLGEGGFRRVPPFLLLGCSRSPVGCLRPVVRTSDSSAPRAGDARARDACFFLFFLALRPFTLQRSPCHARLQVQRTNNPDGSVTEVTTIKKTLDDGSVETTTKVSRVGAALLCR